LFRIQSLKIEMRERDDTAQWLMGDARARIGTAKWNKEI